MAMTMTRETQMDETKLAIVDCDIHTYLPSDKALDKYLPQRWRDYLSTFGRRSASGFVYPQGNWLAARTDSFPPSGAHPGSDYDFLREQILDRYDMAYGVCNPLFPGAGRLLHPELGGAIAQATNDWQIEEWLERDARLRASIIVPYEDGEVAAREIDRLGENPGFVQISFAARTAEPLGRRKYWPIYEAAVRHDLPIGIHFGGAGTGPITNVGHASYYIEFHTGQAASFQDEIISLVCEGVFEQFPTLKFVLIEGGFAWLLPLMWRLDRAWQLLKSEVPHLTRLPSEHIREHFWFTTQPIEEPEHPRDFERLLEDLQMNDKMMFATDYPHWDFDSPEEAIPQSLPADLRRRIFADNARELFHLP